MEQNLKDQNQKAQVQPQAQPPQTKKQVTICCKLPHGLNTRIYKLGETEEGKPIMRATDDRIVFNGANSSNIVGGYGLTQIDADIWEAWIKQHVNFAPVKAGLIYMEERRDRAADRAMDQSAAKTGFEAVDPNKPGKGIEPVPEKELKAAAAMSN